MADPLLGYRVLGKLIGANMNITTDQAIILTASCIVTDIIVTNASTSLTTAAGGVYSAASKGGTAIIAAAQAYSALTTATIAIKLSSTPSLMRIVTGTPATPLSIYLNLTTGQGGAATADFYVLGIDLSA